MIYKICESIVENDGLGCKIEMLDYDVSKKVFDDYFKKMKFFNSSALPLLIGGLLAGFANGLLGAGGGIIIVYLLSNKKILGDKVECDSVVNGVGFVPTPVGQKSNKVHRVGDCIAIGNLRTVIWRAWDVCMKI